MSMQHPDDNGVLRPVGALRVALDERDTPTGDHCDRVCGLSREMGEHLGLTSDELGWLRLAAQLHDIGKIGIADEVLKKPGAFTEEDWRTMQSHAERSERIVRASDLTAADTIAHVVRHHHERFDGGGYPDGLAGEDIPFGARIIAIVDTYDAIARVRHYGRLATHAQIMAELARVAGSQHDPYLSTTFASVAETSRFRVA